MRILLAALAVLLASITIAHNPVVESKLALHDYYGRIKIVDLDPAGGPCQRDPSIDPGQPWAEAMRRLPDGEGYIDYRCLGVDETDPKRPGTWTASSGKDCDPITGFCAYWDSSFLTTDTVFAYPPSPTGTGGFMMNDFLPTVISFAQLTGGMLQEDIKINVAEQVNENFFTVTNQGVLPRFNMPIRGRHQIVSSPQTIVLSSLGPNPTGDDVQEYLLYFCEDFNDNGVCEFDNPLDDCPNDSVDCAILSGRPSLYGDGSEDLSDVAIIAGVLVQEPVKTAANGPVVLFNLSTEATNKIMRIDAINTLQGLQVVIGLDPTGIGGTALVHASGRSIYKKREVVPSYDMAVDGLFIVNDTVQPYIERTSFADIPLDSTGAAITRYHWTTIWTNYNFEEGETHRRVFGNLSKCSYTTLASAAADSASCANFERPSSHVFKAAWIAAVLWDDNTNQIIDIVDIENLQGLSSGSGSSGGIIGPTPSTDRQFAVWDGVSSLLLDNFDPLTDGADQIGPVQIDETVTYNWTDDHAWAGAKIQLGDSPGGASTAFWNLETVPNGDLEITRALGSGSVNVIGGPILGANVTTGADPGHTHTGSSLSGIPISSTLITAGSNIVISTNEIAFDTSVPLILQGTGYFTSYGVVTAYDRLFVSGGTDMTMEGGAIKIKNDDLTQTVDIETDVSGDLVITPTLGDNLILANGDFIGSNVTTGDNPGHTHSVNSTSTTYTSAHDFSGASSVLLPSTGPIANQGIGLIGVDIRWKVFGNKRVNYDHQRWSHTFKNVATTDDQYFLEMSGGAFLATFSCITKPATETVDVRIFECDSSGASCTASSAVHTCDDNGFRTTSWTDNNINNDDFIMVDIVSVSAGATEVFVQVSWAPNW